MFSLILAAGGFLDPTTIIEKGGLALLTAIIFAESGLLIGFFLPGDSLLFIAGFLASEAGGNKLPALWIVCLCTFAAAFLGDQVGYWFGRKVGPSLFTRPDSRLFKQENVKRAHDFFERYGSKTIVLARFVPIVRTFAPIVAGVARMRYRTFVIYNLVGALLWAVGVTTLGYYMGQVDVVKDNIELALIAVVLISLIPVSFEVMRHRRHARQEQAAAARPPAPAPRRRPRPRRPPKPTNSRF